MPQLTPADNIILAAENLQNALMDKLPKDGITELAVQKLMEIFRRKSNKASKERQSQMVQKETDRTNKIRKAATARLATKAQPAHPLDNPPTRSNQVQDDENDKDI